MENKMIMDRIIEMKNSGIADQIKVLDVKNDPFWASPARVRDAMWISNIWKERIKKKTYDRGLHYRLVSLGIECPWGKKRRVHPSPLYMNVDSDFNKLVIALRDARNWGLIPWDAIVDRKHIGLERWIKWGWLEGNREARPFKNWDAVLNYDIDVHVPEVDSIGEARIMDYERDFDNVADRIAKDVIKSEMSDITSNRYQPYYLAVISEKSGLRDIAKNALDRLSCGFDFLNFEGQASTTEVKAFIKNRLTREIPPEQPVAEKKIRLFYISDFDYAGRTMAPAFIQKLIFFLWEENINLDIKIRPLALTKKQVEEYDLPPAPVPAKRLGAKTLQDRWLRDFGSIVEVDSLIELHPGVLENLIFETIYGYVDIDLEDKKNKILDDVEEEAKSAILDAIEEKRNEWESSKEKLDEAMTQINEVIERMRINETLMELSDKLEEIKEEYSLTELVVTYQDILRGISVDFEAPEYDFTSNFEVDEDEDWLFDSSRDMNDQANILRKYKP